MRAYPAARIRNVGLFSHGGAGKTSLAEAMLFVTGAVNRLGKTLDGNTVSDFDPDEVKRQSSINLSVLPIEYRDTKINVLDAPGYFEFVGDMVSAMRVVDLAIILVDAHSGVQVGSDQMWKAARRAGIPTIVVVNKMDQENASFDQLVEQMRADWGNAVTPILVPMGSERAFRGVVNVLSSKAYTFGSPGTGEFQEGEAPPELAADIERYRDMLIEEAVETDDDLTMKYLEGEEITPDELRQGLRAGVLSGTIAPVVASSALNVVGVQQLLDEIVELGPSPLERPETATVPRSDDQVELRGDESGPLAALVFKTLADPFVGKLSYFRVYSGSLRSDSQVVNARTGHNERIGQLFFVRGKDQKPTDHVGAGDIGAVAKLAETFTGDTLSSPDRPLALEGISFPAPSYTVAVLPRTKGDLDKMGTALHRMIEEDPTLHLGREAASGETLVSGMGESHIQIMADRMQRKFGVGVETKLPSVPYRETITTATVSEYKHKKQTGGHGQYGHVILNIEPNQEQEFEFRETIVGGAVPKNYFAAIEKGIQEAIQEGPVAGYPVVNVRVTLTDGSYHSVDSSDMAFKLAASQAFRKGAAEARPTLLEPIMSVTVTVPDQFTGEVMSDLNGKRARVEGMEPSGDGMTTVRAQVPLAEIQRYSSDLRAITQGRGSFTMEFSHYEQVPPHLSQQIVEAARARREEATASR